jgi:hypothetical protein
MLFTQIIELDDTILSVVPHLQRAENTTRHNKVIINWPYYEYREFIMTSRSGEESFLDGADAKRRPCDG